MVKFDYTAQSNEDAKLMSKYYCGDEAAVGELYSRRRQGMIALALRWIPHYLPSRMELAEDFVSDVFVNVMGTQDRPQSQWTQEKGDVQTWLAGILRNRIMSFLRTKKGKEKLSVDASADSEGNGYLSVENRLAEYCDPANRLEENEQRRQLSLALRRLPLEDRRVVMMKFWDDQPYRVISQRIGSSTPTVCRRLKAARQALYNALVG